MCALPTTAYDPTKTIIPRKTFLTFTPAAGTAVSLVGKVANYNQTFDTVRREVPNAQGYLQADRIVAKTRTQTVEFETEDVKAIGGIFGGSTTIEGGYQKGTVEMFVVDPEDAAGKCALKSNAFNAIWYVDGGLNLTAYEVSKVKIKIEATSTIVLTPDASVA